MHRTITITPHARKARRIARRATRKGLRAQIVKSGSSPHRPEFQTIVESDAAGAITAADLEVLGLEGYLIGDTATIRIDGWERSKR